MLADDIGIIAGPRQLSIAEIGVDYLMADRVEGHCFAALFRFGHRMMPLNQRFKRAST